MYLLTRSISGSEELSVIKTVSERVIICKDTLFIGFIRFGFIYDSVSRFDNFPQAVLFHISEDGLTIIILSITRTISLDDLAARIAERVFE